MKEPTKPTLFRMMVLVAFMMALLFPTGMAFAQDETPEQPAVVEEVTDPAPAEESVDTTVEEDTAEENTNPEVEEEEEAKGEEITEAACESIEEEEASAEEAVEPEGEEALGEETAADIPTENGSDEDAIVAEGVEILAESGTVLTDEAGNLLPLASEVAAEILAAPDPVFCSEGGVCGVSRTNMADAISDALASGDSGTIFVEAGTFSGFDLSGFGTSGTPLNLTIQGGIGGTTYFDTQIFLHNNYANIILRDFTVNISGSDAGIGIEGTAVASGADTPTILALDNTGSLTLYNIITTNTFDTALYVGTTSANPDGHTSGDVSLVNVQADGGANTPTEYGAFVENTAGSGDVSVDDSNFHAGGNDALKIKSNGNVTVTDTTASNSGGDGISIESSSPSGANLVTLQNVTASNNTGNGIDLSVKDGSFVLADVIANGNGGDGAYLSTTSTADYSSTNAVIRSTFNSNTGNGLYLRHDAAFLTSMTLMNAIGNSGYGLVVHPSSSPTDSYTIGTCSVNLLDNITANLLITGASTTNPIKWYYCSLQHQNSYVPKPNNGTWIHPLPPGYSSFCNWCADRDYDSDGITDQNDECPAVAGPAENNGCPLLVCPTGSEPDGFGGCIETNMCSGVDHSVDTDNDAIPDGCDSCPNDPDNDADGDGVCGDVDICPGYDDNTDTDGDGVPDGCDACPNDPDNDADGDGVCGDVDNCPFTPNPDQNDYDQDGFGDVCDPTPDGYKAQIPPSNNVGGPIIPVTGGQLQEFDCSLTCSTLGLSGGEMARFCSLCGYFGALLKEGPSTLPGSLPAGFDYQNALTATLVKDGSPILSLPPGSTMMVSFPVPAGAKASDYMLYYWNASSSTWVEITGLSISGGYAEAYVAAPGTFLLVKK